MRLVITLDEASSSSRASKIQNDGSYSKQLNTISANSIEIIEVMVFGVTKTTAYEGMHEAMGRPAQ